MKGYAYAASGCLLAAVVTWIATGTTLPGGAQAGATIPRVASTTEESREGRVSVRWTPPPATRSPAPPEEEPASESTPEPPPPSADDQKVYVHTVFEGEVEDRSWSREASHQVRSGLRDILQDGTQLTSVDCRSSLCKVSLTHADLSAQMNFIDKVVMEDAFWPHGSVVMKEAQSNGQTATSVFFVREGRPLPMLN